MNGVTPDHRAPLILVFLNQMRMERTFLLAVVFSHLCSKHRSIA
jgi:hypothetical protein